MSISLSTYQALSIFLLFLFGIIGLIYFLNRRLNSFSQKEDAVRVRKTWKDHFSQYPEVIFYRWRGTVLRLGFFIALSFTLVSFAITKKEYKSFSMEMTPLMEDTVKVIRTSFPKEKMQKLEEVTIEEVEEIVPEDEPKFLDPQEILKQAIDSLILSEEPIDTTESNGFNESLNNPIRQLPEPPKIKDEEPPIVMVPEDNPRFPGCENMDGSKKEKEKCAEEAMLKFIYDNLKYPSIAKDNNKEGRVIVQFVVNQFGKVENIEVVRGIGFGCDEAAARVVKKMNDLPEKWTPGRQMGRAVKVKFTLPITFQLK